MKIDLHVHSGISVCASATFTQVVDSYAAAGINFVLTNHYNALYLKENGGGYSRKDYPVCYVDEFYRTKEYGEKKGIKVFFGIEAALTLPDCPYAEFLIYGAEPKFLLDNPFLFELDQRGLFELCEKNGLCLVQAHPFRKEQGHFPHDCTLVHGVEINCHFRFLREEEKVRALADKYGLIVTCGSDFHYVGQECAGGIVCEDVYNEQELKKILFDRKFEIFVR